MTERLYPDHPTLAGQVCATSDGRVYQLGDDGLLHAIPDTPRTRRAVAESIARGGWDERPTTHATSDASHARR